MTIVKDAGPLRWPPGWPRTAEPRWSQFATSYEIARKRLIRELQLLGATEIVITTNIARRKDGTESLAQPKSIDTGVCVYFTVNGQQRAIPCDKWRLLQDNVHAIELTVAALRGLERWGAQAMVDAAFAGFAALPEVSGAGESWWAVLEVDPRADRAEIDRAYRRLVRQAHPDAGGSQAEFQRVQGAYEAAKGATVS